MLKGLELKHVYDRDVSLLSGGELQRFAIGTVCVQKADVVSHIRNILPLPC